MFVKKKASLVLVVILFFAVILGLSPGSVCAQEVDRIVTVKVVADEEYRQFHGPKYNWKYVAEKVVKKASKALKEQFGISFEVIGFEEWDTIDEYSWLYFSPQLELMEEIKPGYAEIVIGFTGQGIDGLGVTNKLLGRYVLILDNISSIPWIKKELYEKHKEFYQAQKGWETWEDWCVKFIAPQLCMDIAETLVHELGHVFGADHTIELNSVMNVALDNHSKPCTRFDEENSKIIFRNKHLNLKKAEELKKKANAAYIDVLRQEQEVERREYYNECTDEERQELRKTVAKCWMEAAEIYEKAGFSWSNAVRAAEAYKAAGSCLKITGQDEKAQEVYQKAGNLFLEVAKGYERQDDKSTAVRLYKRAIFCFELAGCEEKVKEVRPRFDELVKERTRELEEELSKEK